MKLNEVTYKQIFLFGSEKYQCFVNALASSGYFLCSFSGIVLVFKTAFQQSIQSNFGT